MRAVGRPVPPPTLRLEHCGPGGHPAPRFLSPSSRHRWEVTAGGFSACQLYGTQNENRKCSALGPSQQTLAGHLTRSAQTYNVSCYNLLEPRCIMLDAALCPRNLLDSWHLKSGKALFAAPASGGRIPALSFSRASLNINQLSGRPAMGRRPARQANWLYILFMITNGCYACEPLRWQKFQASRSREFLEIYRMTLAAFQRTSFPRPRRQNPCAHY